MKALNQSLDRVHLRVVVVGLVFLALVAALVLRLWSLQILSADAYTKKAVANIARAVPVLAARGSILDRNGQVLANNRASSVVSVDRGQFEVPDAKVKGQEDLTAQGQRTLIRLSDVLQIPTSTLVAQMNSPQALPYTDVPVATNVPQDEVVFIEEHQANGDNWFPGVTAGIEPLRNYPNGPVAANMLGYIGPINSTETANSAYAGDAANSSVGRSGIEQEYEKYLHGTDGTTLEEVNAQGDIQGQLSVKPPVDGDNLVTSIDLNVQNLVEQSLTAGITQAQTEIDPTTGKKYPAVAGGAVVMDPHSGQILAMASAPSFDPNEWVGGISEANYLALSQPPYPLINRITQAAFAPGSTFKIVPAAAALGTGLAAPGGFYPCPSQVVLDKQTFKNFEATDGSSISLSQALTQSCDTVFYNFGQQFYDRFVNNQGEVLQQYAREFGFGKRTGVDIPYEAPGLVPDNTWLQTVHKQYPQAYPYNIWLPGYTIQMAIGQGDVLATPLQIATAYAAIANGGTLYQPEIGLRIMKGDQVVRQINPVVKGHLPVSASDLALIQQGLQGVVMSSSGTANAAFNGFPLGQIPVSGKTGTAEVGVTPGITAPFAWFVSYAPSTNPQYVVCVMLEQGGFGAQTAAPIAEHILEGLNNLPLTGIGQGAGITG